MLIRWEIQRADAAARAAKKADVEKDRAAKKARRDAALLRKRNAAALAAPLAVEKVRADGGVDGLSKAQCEAVAIHNFNNFSIKQHTKAAEARQLISQLICQSVLSSV